MLVVLTELVGAAGKTKVHCSKRKYWFARLGVFATSCRIQCSIFATFADVTEAVRHMSTQSLRKDDMFCIAVRRSRHHK